MTTRLAPRIVSEGPALSPEDVADRLGAIADTYSTSGDPHVVVVDGFGVRVVVHHGALTVADGVGEHRRERHYPKVAPPERLIVSGDGMVTTEALAWCRSQGTAVLVLGAGDLLLGSSASGRNDPRIRRAQALAAGSPAGLGVVRDLLEAKLAGQAAVLRAVFGDERTAATVDDLAGGIGVARDVDEARQFEAVAAAAYFAAWSGHPATAVGFVARDRRRVPPHWQTFDSRRSAITGAANTNRSAERPLNALLNYLYKLAEVEARFACVRLGLDPGLGVLHLDAAGRDSLALDIIEPVRPVVDRFVLDLVAERTFAKRDFVERSDGHVRVAAPLTHELATTLPTWQRAIAPHAERVAHLFADEVTGKTTPTTPLTGARTRAASEVVRRRKAAEARARAEAAHGEHRASRPTRRPAPVDPERAAARFATCVDCGGPLARSRHVRCPSCWERQPGQSRDARRRRGRSIAMARNELEAWKAEHPHANADPEQFSPIRAGLADVRLSTIMAACQVSKATASGWRSGRHVPALRHWAALALLVGMESSPSAPVTPTEQTGREEAGAMNITDTTTATPTPADLRQRAAIARSRERRQVELSPIRTEVADAIEVVGWRKARPVIEGALGTVPVKGRHGAWWGQVGKRAGARILAGLAALPVEPHQERLPLKRVRSTTSTAFDRIALVERQTLASTMEGS